MFPFNNASLSLPPAANRPILSDLDTIGHWIGRNYLTSPVTYGLARRDATISNICIEILGHNSLSWGSLMDMNSMHIDGSWYQKGIFRLDVNLNIDF